MVCAGRLLGAPFHLSKLSPLLFFHGRNASLPPNRVLGDQRLGAQLSDVWQVPVRLAIVQAITYNEPI